eukprot:186238_1
MGLSQKMSAISISSAVSVSNIDADTLQNIQNHLVSFVEWTIGIVFTQRGDILGSKTESDVSAEDIRSYIRKFDDYDRTVADGILVDDTLFDVHKMYDTIISGRDRNNPNGPGVVLCKHNIGDSSSLYMLATFSLPTISTSTIPKMQRALRHFSQIILDSHDS